jgi:predicted Zn finger-like uncharacterized protein
MRLVCPNCEAKYEVPDDAIPDTGRDVQCASCGHAWYQMRPRSGAVEAAAAPVAPPVAEPEAEAPIVETPVADAVVEPEGVPTPEPEPQPEPGPEPETVLASEPVPEPEIEAEAEAAIASDALDLAAEPEAAALDDADVLAATDAAVTEVEAAVEDAAAAEPEAEPEPEADSKAAYAVDDSVLAILREEAERESNARRAEARPLEVQADLGIDSAAATPAMAAAVEDKPSARRDLLPDVEEINSTLRPSETEAAGDDGSEGLVAAQRSGGFRSGFLWVMTVAMLGAGLYLAAPSLSRSVPALAGPLETYVGMINGLRLELDGLMRSATLALDAD